MNIKKLIEKLENDLGHFLIAELCKSDPSKRSGGELYKYKGLSITIKSERKDQDKIISIRIGVFEADFKVLKNVPKSWNIIYNILTKYYAISVVSA